jgi:CRISPR-associated protein Cas1
LQKIQNQSGLLKELGIEHEYMHKTSKKVLSGDRGNLEAQAARYYWKVLFDPFLFKRYRYGKPPNNLLNYGYAILRAVIARALSGSGLLPGVGIHHKNRYNAYPLADDIMEPYRPYVDEIVWNLAMNEYDISELSSGIKRELLEIPNLPVMLDEQPLSLMLAASRTTASLHRCFSGDSRKLLYPII